MCLVVGGQLPSIRYVADPWLLPLCDAEVCVGSFSPKGLAAPPPTNPVTESATFFFFFFFFS